MEYRFEKITINTSDGEEVIVKLKPYQFFGNVMFLSENEFNENYEICSMCGKAYKIDDATNIQEDIYEKFGDKVCSTCADEEYRYCGNCGELHLVNEMSWVNGIEEYYCEECFYDCCFVCPDCDEVYLCDHGYYSEYEDQTYCEYCYYEYGHDRRQGIIESYHGHSCREKSEFIDKENRSSSCHIGYELELDVQPDFYGDCNDDAEWVDSHIPNYFVFEEDSTIGGFEMISRPGSVDAHLKRFEELKSVSSYLVSNGYRSHDGGHCGLHTHIDRKYFGDTNTSQQLAEAKFLLIFNRHWENLCKFSRRRNFRWCEKNPSGNIAEDVKTQRYKHCSHGVAVNISNENTIELRIWRGSLKLSTIEATLRMANRLAYVVKHTNVVKLNSMTWEDIMGTDPVILEYWETVKNRTI